MNMNEKHSMPQSIGLHLLPGLLITAGYLLFTPSVIENGFPALLGLLISFLVFGLPVQLGYVIYQVKKGAATFKEIIYGFDKWTAPESQCP